MRSRKNTRRAFTLIELMIVVSIIGLLAAVLVPNIIGVMDGSRQETTLASMSKVKDALLLYKKDHKRFPSSLNDLTTKKNDLTKQPYLQEMSLDGWDEPYQYTSKDSGKNFELKSYGADGESGGQEHDSDILCTKEKKPYVENPGD